MKSRAVEKVFTGERQQCKMSNLNLIEKRRVIPQKVFWGKNIPIERQLSSTGEQSRSQDINAESTAGAARVCCCASTCSR